MGSRTTCPTRLHCPSTSGNMDNVYTNVQASLHALEEGIATTEVERLTKENEALHAELRELRQMLEEAQFVNKSLESQIQALEGTLQKIERREMHGVIHGNITDLTVGAEGPELDSVNVQASFELTKSTGCVRGDINAPDDAAHVAEGLDIAATVRQGSRNIKTFTVLKSPYGTTTNRGEPLALRRHTRLSVAASKARANLRKCRNRQDVKFELRRLTDIEDTIVTFAFCRSLPKDEILFKCEGMTLTRELFLSLAPGEKVQAPIVDTLTMLYNMQQLHTTGVIRFYFNFIFLLYLMRDPVAPNYIYDPERIKCHVGDVGWIFLPICRGDHWFACAFDTVCEEIFLSDSMSTSGEYRIEMIKSEVAYAIEEYYHYVGEPKAVSSWDVKHANGLPHQNNGVDCGVYMLCNMFLFVSEKTPKYRSGQIVE